MLKGRLLLLLRFSSASFFPAVPPSSLWTFAPVLHPLGTSAWKNLCRADCVFWAEAVQDSEDGPGRTGWTGASGGASRTEDGRRAGSDPLVPPPPRVEGPEQPLWLQTKVPGRLPGR